MAISTILAFLKSLPDLIRLVELIETHIQDAKADRQVKDDVKVISDAFSSKDATKLNALFNSN